LRWVRVLVVLVPRLIVRVRVRVDGVRHRVRHLVVVVLGVGVVNNEKRIEVDLIW
jgi:hypothetical protein